MTIAYLVFGPDQRNHQQAAFSILSLLAEPSTPTHIVVLTDRPDGYTLLGGRVEVRTLDPAQLEEWTGEHGFFWRVKLKALEALVAERDGAVLYLDADTFRYGPLAALAARLAAGDALMHTVEGRLAAILTRSERRLYTQVAGRTFAGVTVGPDDVMWNAGLVGLPARTGRATVALALAICDEMCAAGVESKLTEQFALSLALGKTARLAPADDVIGHYWGNKVAWTERIGAFFIREYLGAADADALVAAVAREDLRSTPIRTRPSHSGRRLKALVDRLFRAKAAIYLPPAAARAPAPAPRTVRTGKVALRPGLATSGPGPERS